MARVQFRRDTAANWVLVNPVLADGEIGIEKDSKRFKIGDGVTAWTLLSYSSRSFADAPKEYILGLEMTEAVYDAGGKLLSTTYNNSHKLIYTYDTTGRLTTVTYTDVDGVSTLFVETYNYNIDGLLASITR